jgi:hypothetical protein
MSTVIRQANALMLIERGIISAKMSANMTRSSMQLCDEWSHSEQIQDAFGEHSTPTSAKDLEKREKRAKLQWS